MEKDKVLEDELKNIVGILGITAIIGLSVGSYLIGRMNGEKKFAKGFEKGYNTAIGIMEMFAGRRTRFEDESEED